MGSRGERDIYVALMYSSYQHHLVQNHRFVRCVNLLGWLSRRLGFGTNVKYSSAIAVDKSDQRGIDASTVDAGP